MATQQEIPEGGLRNHRVEFVRESEFGVTGADPDFLKYSKAVTNVTWTSDAVVEPVMHVGSADPESFLKGPESHEVTIDYDLVKYFDDGSGNANDASYDGLARDSDNLFPNSHTMVDREDKGTLAAENTVNGSQAYASRIYKVGRGGVIDEVTVTGDPSDAQPLTVELSYLFQKVRVYQVDQPSASTLLFVKSDDANDTTQTVTIEDEGGTTTEDVTLSGTTAVSTSNQYTDIDAIELSAECAGDVTVGINTGDATAVTEGDSLAVIKGSGSYNDVEGDLGIPALGAGSRETVASLGSYEQIIGDVIQRGGADVPYEVAAIELDVSNNTNDQEQTSRFGKALHPGNREIVITATIFGESATYESLVDHLTATTQDLTWALTGGTVTLTSTVITDPGDITAEEGGAIMTTDNGFRATGISF